ncbi:hypothetical protein F1880_006618 [Penicillium rolfsii]|nr:hypothetical protein F1880_006618 [Penicillium rolfsii]
MNPPPFLGLDIILSDSTYLPMSDIVPTKQSLGPGNGRRRYMSKAQRACDGCRARKSACQINDAPPCRLCLAHGQPCEFTSRVRRRRSPRTEPGQASTPPQPHFASPPHSESQSHPYTNPYPLAEVQFTDAAFATQRSLADLTADHIMDFTFPGVIEEVPNHEPPQSNHENFDELILDWYSSSRPQELAQGSRDIPRSLDNLHDLTAQLCGLTGDMDPYVLQHYQYNAKSEFAFSKLTVRQVQKFELPVQFLLSRPVFFQFIQPQFPILSESTPTTPALTPTHLLAAIYCIAQPFSMFDDYLCIELVYTPPSAQNLLTMAWRSLSLSLSQPTISSVQTALILLLILPTNPLLLDSAWKWNLLGITVSMAQTLGLQFDARSWNIPEPEVVLRRRLSWLVYTVDKWLAFSLGRPSHITSHDWLVTDINKSDFVLEESIPNFPFHFAKLTTILDRVLVDLYHNMLTSPSSSLRSSYTLVRDFRLTLETARPLLDDLKSLAEHTSAALSPDGTEDQKPYASLDIAYHSLKILIFRALLRPFNNAGCQASPEEMEEWEAARTHIRQAARAEIEATLNRISGLEAMDYQAFWAPWYKTSFALITHLGFLLAVTSFKDAQIPSERADLNGNPDYVECRALLDKARTVLRLHSKSLDIIKFALLRIDAVFWVGWEKVIGSG